MIATSLVKALRAGRSAVVGRTLRASVGVTTPWRAYHHQTIRLEHRTLEADARNEPFYFVDEAARSDIGFISPWHSIALRPSGAAANIVNFVCEIPRGTTPKFEISTTLPHNPIVQDRKKDGSLRNYAFKALVNYGAIPQTYEDPDHKDALTGLLGDGDPVDVCEIGSNVAQTGSVYPVKVLGALGLIDGGEMDWKLLAVRTSDPLAAALEDVGDLAKVPDLVKLLTLDVAHWLRTYKIPEGKGENKIAFEGRWLGRDSALQVIEATHAQWAALVKRSHASSGMQYAAGFGADAIRVVKPGKWVPPRLE